MDLAETIHRAIYKKCGYINANKDPEFIAGFKVGDHYPLASCIFEVISAEYRRRGEPVDGSPEWDIFKEWKRGFMAARLQKAFANLQR